MLSLFLRGKDADAVADANWKRAMDTQHMCIRVDFHLNLPPSFHVALTHMLKL
jgi:hypothetical protein